MNSCSSSLRYYIVIPQNNCIIFIQHKIVCNYCLARETSQTSKYSTIETNKETQSSSATENVTAPLNRSGPNQSEKESESDENTVKKNLLMKYLFLRIGIYSALLIILLFGIYIKVCSDSVVEGLTVTSLGINFGFGSGDGKSFCLIRPRIFMS